MDRVEHAAHEDDTRGTGVDRATRAASFGTLAADYDRHRPGYPDAALDWVLESMTATAPVLLDLAAGTGKLTASLLRRPGAGVVAVEPDEGMLAVLRARLPEARALAGPAEAIPLPDASVDAVLVGQAFHWFDVPAATAEIVRVLRPGGVLGLLWNHEAREVEWVRGYYRAVGWTRAGSSSDPDPLPGDAALTRSETRVFDNPLPMTTDGLLATLSTYSWISTLPAEERARRVAAGRDYLRGRCETSAGEFELPLRTTVLRSERLPGRR